jgi:hypothetical protein|tara:strand:+ start:283 stop:498 length:216 start_codon:yes stop_codon:yes gene_type:complete
MKSFVFLVVLVLFILSVYFYCEHKGKCKVKNTQEHTQDNRIDKIKRAQMNLHPVRNSNVDRGSDGRFKRKL